MSEERKRAIEEVRAAFAADILEASSSMSDGIGCDTCGPDYVTAWTMDGINSVLDYLLKKPLDPKAKEPTHG